jgi:uncharacterized protein
MNVQTILILLIVGFGAGILGGLVGIGGGIIIVPCLIYFLQYTQLQAQGTSLGLLMLPVGILGFINYYQKCKDVGTPINYTVIAIIAVGFVVGSFLGSKVAVQVDKTMLKNIFAFVLIAIAAKMLFLDK